ncbi:glycosyltransferase [Hymenobacter sp. AT01-02]|uniref:glycosyltransferase n=1 Tax=Hymenobacter sp. AT01-02 TaxID=1571877 RepID=UPI0006977DE3|nr:glycosyltransferase [Hymenobacter sp. AT01-02]
MSSWALNTLLAGQVVVAAVYLSHMLRLRHAWLHSAYVAGGQPTVETGANENQPATEIPHAATPSLPKDKQALAFSILVAARNEAATLPQLLHDIGQQQAIAGGFEVIVVDDHSTDATAAIVREATRRVPFPLRLLQLAAESGGGRTGKKAAVEAAVRVARAPWVLLTDADCRVPVGWVRAYAELLEQHPDTQFISGPVLLTGSGWLATLQGLELAGLVGVGAASVGVSQPTMCNGANLAYARVAFYAVEGFRGNEAIPSGDDEFLLHKLHKVYPTGIRFLRDARAIVSTAAQPTLRQLLWQRVRWASKWRHYQAAAPQRLAVLVLLANLTFPVGAALWLAGAQYSWLAPLAWALKLAADVLLLGPVLRFLGRPGWLAWVPVLQLAYAPYAVATGLLGLRGGYEWKGRSVK